MEKKQVTLGELFTEKELQLAITIVKRGQSVNRQITESIVKPIMARIDTVTGQKNDARYWAYALEYAATQVLYKETRK